MDEYQPLHTPYSCSSSLSSSLDLRHFHNVTSLTMKSLGILFVELLRFVPSFTVKTSLRLLPFRKRLPHQGQPFIVNGLNPSLVSWFVEAEDRKSADPVVVFLHGGGYFLGLNPFFMVFLAKFYKAANDDRLSILILDYTLTTRTSGKYPRQLDELTKLYLELQKTCTNITLLGDSAGGHLALNFLRHNKTPETPDVITIEDFIHPKRVILISPWLNPTLDCRARHIDRFTHYFSVGALNQFQKFHGRPLVHYSVDEVIPQVLHSTLVIYGSNEAMRGDIEEFIELNQKQNVAVRSKMIRRGIHDSGVVWPFGKNTVANVSGEWFSDYAEHSYV